MKLTQKQTIRPLKQGEEEILLTLIKELAQYEKNDPPSLTVEKLQSYLSKSLFQVELAEHEDEIVGYALYYYGFAAHKGFPILYLEDLYVKPPFRKAGIGSALIKKMTEYAKQNECCRISWLVLSWNEQAIAFYKKIGCKLRNDLIPVRLEIS